MNSLRNQEILFERIREERRYKNRIFYFAVEGTETEVDYFERIKAKRKEIGIKEPLEIIVLEKKDGKNNPLALLENLLEVKRKESYEPSDELCLICDRDKESFTQFDEVLEKCQENKINFGLSNPCFEFWLLLHLNDCINFNSDELLANTVQSRRHTYISNLISEELKKINPQCQGYAKDKISVLFPFFQGKLENAIKNAKIYEIENSRLKTQLGTSVGILMEKLMKARV